MNYIPLNNIGNLRRNADGSLSSNREPGNNYPSSVTGIPKSAYVEKKENKIVLYGAYDKNTKTYPFIDPEKSGVISIPKTTFKFLIKDIATKQVYASEVVYQNLIKARNEANPWYSLETLPIINLDLQFLISNHKINKYDITQFYCGVTLLDTLNSAEDIIKYIDWMVKPSLNVNDINLIKTFPDGSDSAYLGDYDLLDDPQIGLGYKKTYDSMIKDKNPDPDAIEGIPVNESYDLSLPTVTQPGLEFQQLPDNEIIPKLANALIEVRKPRSQTTYSPFGDGALKWIATTVIVAATVASVIIPGGQAATPLLFGLLGSGTLATAGGLAAAIAVNSAVGGALAGVLTNIRTKAPGSYIEFILARTTDRGAFEGKDKVFEKERKADEDDWNALLSAAKSKMGVTRYNAEHLKAALAIALSQFSNTNSSKLSYTMNVGWWGDNTGTFTLSVQNPSQIKVDLKIT
jgi:hypothetical protein